ncbi:MAG: phosphonate metabolism transcriptional regulator PhnF [Novibacillus thermophilus]|uniref:Phosphonate metabolism transcriptional regulator PhnF n=1 Tax=Novibacillus thermophilus TaxID=1471761 RepID=A0A1U9KA62_9BACL|nr:phosphonate metabolism transcriptional regulator PhnF [Novibacillus thermophilus]AQS56914.1 phosphonate metabolism transcriptional regulator PhnF [Novibacillus thermophilus]
MMPAKEQALHLEIAEYLIGNIRTGVFAENEKIPSEQELCLQFQVNRHVVRQAIARVASLGWVTPVQGKGCYVNRIPKPVRYDLSSRTRFSENMNSQGVRHKGQLLEWEERVPTEEERENLALDDGETVYRLEILRYIEDQPLSVTTTVLPVAEFPDLPDYFHNFHSLYDILINHYHFRPIRERSVFQATLPALQDVKILQMPENVPVMEITSLMKHPGGFPVEFSISRIRGDMTKCLVEF